MSSESASLNCGTISTLWSLILPSVDGHIFRVRCTISCARWRYASAVSLVVDLLSQTHAVCLYVSLGFTAPSRWPSRSISTSLVRHFNLLFKPSDEMTSICLMWMCLLNTFVLSVYSWLPVRGGIEFKLATLSHVQSSPRNWTAISAVGGCSLSLLIHCILVRDGTDHDSTGW